MRLLLITGEFPPMQGGVGDYTREIALEFAARGDEVRVLTSSQGTGTGGVDVAPVMPNWGWRSLASIAAAVREYAPQVVHIQYQTGAYGMHPAINFSPRYLRRFAHSSTVPRVVTTFHDLRIPYLFPKAGPVREWVTRALAAASDAVIATNEQDWTKLATWSKPLALIPIGSNITTTPPAGYDRTAWRQQLGVAPDELLLCHFGFVNDRKGCDTLVRALPEVEAKLLMIGGQTGASDPTNAAVLARLQEQIVALDLYERVRWTGFTPPETVTAHFRAADLCVLPYREGASYQHGTLMAALAHGLPIITTVPRAANLPHPSPLPSLRDGENCLLVPPDDAHALAQAIQRAAASPEMRARLSQGACDLARHFTWQTIVDQHIELYEQIC